MLMKCVFSDVLSDSEFAAFSPFTITLRSTAFHMNQFKSQQIKVPLPLSVRNAVRHGSFSKITIEILGWLSTFFALSEGKSTDPLNLQTSYHHSHNHYSHELFLINHVFRVGPCNHRLIEDSNHYNFVLEGTNVRDTTSDITYESVIGKEVVYYVLSWGKRLLSSWYRCITCIGSP